MQFPYKSYETFLEGIKIYYPAGEEVHARRIVQTTMRAGELLSTLLKQPMPPLEVLLVATDDWSLAPREEAEENTDLLPYWTNVRTPGTLVVPVEVASVFGEPTQEKLAFMLYQALTLAFLEDDQRPWPDDYPLWADEWQLKVAALWLAQRLDAVQGLVNKDLREEYADIFEPEADGKTPVTIRGFDWFEDTAVEDYLTYELLLEQFAADLLAKYESDVLPHFLDLYRNGRTVLLSDDATLMLASVLGAGGEEWLESLVYF
ncbi:MAG: hypothetical protein H0V70_24210 [Ktedonobacteraceae bacterium]|nr:hypothetical protein [Ktedonobacteraceae bacterium]